MSDPYELARAETKRQTVPMSELAELIGISPAHCYELARRGELPVPVERLPNGGRYIIKRSDTDRYFGTLSAPAPTPLNVVPAVASGLLDALTHAKQQAAWWAYQASQIEQQIAAEQAADRAVS